MIKWEREFIDCLIELHLAGRTSSQIAVELFQRFSLNASNGSINAKIFHLRAAGEIVKASPKTIPRRKGQKPPTPAKKRNYLDFKNYVQKDQNPLKMALEDVVEPSSEYVKPFIHRRMFFECAWIHNPSAGIAICCGAPTVRLKQYCEYHCSKVYVKAKEHS